MDQQSKLICTFTSLHTTYFKKLLIPEGKIRWIYIISIVRELGPGSEASYNKLQKVTSASGTIIRKIMSLIIEGKQYYQTVKLLLGCSALVPRCYTSASIRGRETRKGSWNPQEAQSRRQSTKPEPTGAWRNWEPYPMRVHTAKVSASWSWSFHDGEIFTGPCRASITWG